jgi:DNA polymerase III epsilon subunit-like protein
VKDFFADSPIVAHAYKNERDFLDYEFARAKMIEWGESAYAEERYICTQVLFAQLFPGSSKSLTSMCDRLVLDSRAEVFPAKPYSYRIPHGRVMVYVDNAGRLEKPQDCL